MIDQKAYHIRQLGPTCTINCFGDQWNRCWPETTGDAHDGCEVFFMRSCCIETRVAEEMFLTKSCSSATDEDISRGRACSQSTNVYGRLFRLAVFFENRRLHESCFSRHETQSLDQLANLYLRNQRFVLKYIEVLDFSCLILITGLGTTSLAYKISSSSIQRQPGSVKGCDSNYFASVNSILLRGSTRIVTTQNNRSTSEHSQHVFRQLRTSRNLSKFDVLDSRYIVS